MPERRCEGETEIITGPEEEKIDIRKKRDGSHMTERRCGKRRMKQCRERTSQDLTA